MSDNPWFKFFPSDWLAGTGGLTAAERGVYITIVCMIYEASGPIPYQPTRLARRCGVPAGSFKRILESLIDQGKLVLDGDKLTNNRSEKEIDAREKLRTKQQSGAQKTNAIRKEKSEQKQRQAKRTASRSAHAYQKPEARSQNISPNGDVDPAHLDDVSEAFRYYNEVAERAGWGKAAKATSARMASLRRRIADAGGLDEWKRIIDGAVTAPFLRGENDRGWKANLDFFCQESSFVKLMEGFYAGKSKTQDDKRREEQRRRWARY